MIPPIFSSTLSWMIWTSGDGALPKLKVLLSYPGLQALPCASMTQDAPTPLLPHRWLMIDSVKASVRSKMVHCNLNQGLQSQGRGQGLRVPLLAGRAARDRMALTVTYVPARPRSSVQDPEAPTQVRIQADRCEAEVPPIYWQWAFSRHPNGGS